MPALLTIAEVAARLRHSDVHVLRLIHARKLAAVNTGTGRRASWRISEDEVDRFLEIRKPAPKPERKRREKKPKGFIEYV